MGERLLLFLALRDGRPIAGALNFIGADTLYGRYWGAIEEVPFLHFELCYYQAIDWAIERGLARVEAGAQGGGERSADQPGRDGSPMSAAPATS
jgi:predicted N-acyltransferase